MWRSPVISGNPWALQWLLMTPAFERSHIDILPMNLRWRRTNWSTTWCDRLSLLWHITASDLHSVCTDCMFTDCASCVSNNFNCTWCMDTCHSSVHPCSFHDESEEYINGTKVGRSGDDPKSVSSRKYIGKKNPNYIKMLENSSQLWLYWA